MIHLGLGAFHRAHQAWYTQVANDHGDDWGIEAFTGRSNRLADALEAQDCVYALIERGADADSAQLIESISHASHGDDRGRWRAAFADPQVVIVSLTVTEAGYHADEVTGIDWTDPDVRADLDRLADGSGPAPRTAPARLVDGLRARRRGPGAPIAVVSCDNLAGNGRVTRDAVLALATRLDPGLASWIANRVSFVSTVVDRITPAAAAGDPAAAQRLTGFADRVPVVTEPFSEWILSGGFPGGRPRWELAGARFVADITPFEQRKLWLLNAGHSLLAYRGLRLGHDTIAEAMADPLCVEPLGWLWQDAATVLPFEPAELEVLLTSLRSRFANARIEHRLVQVAGDGSLKLPLRVVEPLRRRVQRGLPAGRGQAALLAAWTHHLRQPPADHQDPRAVELGARLAGMPAIAQAGAVLGFLAPDLADDLDVAAAVAAEMESQAAHSPTPGRR